MQAGLTSPAHGLYALAVRYPEDRIEWPDELMDCEDDPRDSRF